MVLEKITQANDIQKIPLEEFPILAQEIRDFLISHLSRTGGHLASNLGAVELTMALHNVFNLPEDKIIWDVGHQSYTHKILTGRKEMFDNLRKENGLSGFPKRSESDCDAFDTGHSSTSISAGLGYVTARDLLEESYRVVSVIGDGALTGGMAYEALNNAAELKTNFIIVLNDNTMSISKNVGGISQYLSGLRTAEAYTGLKMGVTKLMNKVPKAGPAIVSAIRNTKRGIKQLIIPGMLFENMGLTYLGPADGHNTRQMMRLLNEAKRVEGPVIIHVLTQKGKGFEPAVRHPERFHGTAPYDCQTGIPLSNSGKAHYTDIFSTVMMKFGARNEKVVAISAAMPTGTGLKRFANKYAERFFDVGIAEEHAVTFAAGLALGGLIPIVAIYSSFLQRAFDQVIQDVCIQNLHVIFAIDRAGIVGADGETHNGCFDVSYLSMIPNMTVMAPKNKWELSDMLKFAVTCQGPIAIRYPKGEAYDGLEDKREPIEYGKSERLLEGKDTAVLALGSMVETAAEAIQLCHKEGIHPSFINARFAKPLDYKMLDRLAAYHTTIITIEENAKRGGFGEQVQNYIAGNYPHIQVKILAIPDDFIAQASVKEGRAKAGLTVDSVVQMIKETT
ncbi:MAG: 1-deoxy-D-xylulose-5-phosphate synthase [Lachnospiraceae bacterium]